MQISRPICIGINTIQIIILIHMKYQIYISIISPNSVPILFHITSSHPLPHKCCILIALFAPSERRPCYIYNISIVILVSNPDIIDIRN